ncbi:Hypothetical predicted protein [Mytilus galloprovincialis]|uniref:Uncharacterized protein n=1 Tax=Mytilus galloprovincialis TaxID=29158 RepID=A0A8B6CJG5_MYTGA|nr:Hypothetical predicted protein [Mytilus galloprovincialis]
MITIIYAIRKDRFGIEKQKKGKSQAMKENRSRRREQHRHQDQTVFHTEFIRPVQREQRRFDGPVVKPGKRLRKYTTQASRLNLGEIQHTWYG